MISRCHGNVLSDAAVNRCPDRAPHVHMNCNAGAGTYFSNGGKMASTWAQYRPGSEYWYRRIPIWNGSLQEIQLFLYLLLDAGRFVIGAN